MSSNTNYSIPKIKDDITQSTINSAAENLVPLLELGEQEMSDKYASLATKEPGTITQSDLLGVQMAMQRWQLVSQLITAVISGIGQALKTTAQNIR